MQGLVEGGEYVALIKRGINEETCRKFGYKVGTYQGKPVQIAPYHDDSGELAAQKLRFPGKEFRFVGDPASCGLFGQQLWRNKGKRVVVTEGEIDAMSVAQAFNLKWQVVSVPNGAQGAKKSIAKNLEWLEGFDEVVLAFDNDEPGRAAARECAALFTPGKAKILTWSGGKDANDLVQAGREGDIPVMVFEAKAYRPDGILAGTELKEQIDLFRSGGGAYFSFDTQRPQLDLMTQGLRKGELVMLTAGTGVGKSTEAAEMAHDLLARHKLTIGYVALEENPLRTSLRFMSIHVNHPLHLGKGATTDEEYEDAYAKTVGSGRFYLYDHFGSLESNNLFSKLKYLANGCGCDFIVLDHISIAVADSEESDERKQIDRLMARLRSLVEQTGVGVIAVCHLRKSSGGGATHEEGGRVTLDDLRGSGSLKQFPDTIIGIERNQQDKDESDYSQVRVLKCRFTGMTGLADTLHYNRKTGRLLALDREAATEFEANIKEEKSSGEF